MPLFSGPPVNGRVSSSMLIGSAAMDSCRRPFAYPLAAFSFPPAGSPSYPRRLKCRFPHVFPGFTGRPKADRPLFPLRDPAAHAACFIVWGFPNAPFIFILEVYKRQAAAWGVLVLGALLTALGVWRGEAETVLQKAVMICMECIGIG